MKEGQHARRPALLLFATIESRHFDGILRGCASQAPMDTAEAEIRMPTAVRQDVTSGARALDLPEAAQPVQIEWGYLVNIVLIHALSLFIFWPGYLSWTGFLLALVCFHMHGLLGI